MEEFSEIEPGGFKIEFTPGENGGCMISMDASSSKGPIVPNRFIRVIKTVINDAGVVLEMDCAWNSPYLRTYGTYIVSDREGLFGRVCLACKSYFRTNSLKKKLVCPYCTVSDVNGAFTTENQKKFMALCGRAINEAIEKGIKNTFDMGLAIKELPNNRPAWIYSEENQQHTFSCDTCREFNVPIVFNILGEFGNCPSCGKRNYRTVFEAKINY